MTIAEQKAHKARVYYGAYARWARKARECPSKVNLHYRDELFKAWKAI